MASGLKDSFDIGGRMSVPSCEVYLSPGISMRLPWLDVHRILGVGFPLAVQFILVPISLINSTFVGGSCINDGPTDSKWQSKPARREFYLK